MSSYIPVPVDTDPVDLANEAFDYIAGKVPNWTPANGNLEAWLVESLAQIAGELRTLTALVPDSIFAYFGASILGLPPFAAVQATAVTDWTATDTAGYTVPAGTVIAVTPPASSTGHAFAVDAAFTIPAGSSTATGVVSRALQAGSEASGVTGAVTVIDQLTFVKTVTLDGATSGGQDAETTAAYLARLSALLTLLSPRPILPQDFAVLAQRQVAGVARATAIDLYNPGPPPATNVPRCVTVAVCDSDGQPVAPTVKQEVDDLLQAAREVNFLVFVVDPTYTTVDVTFAATSFPGWDPADVQARAITAVRNYLDPGSWGVPPFGDTSGRSWLNATVVRHNELIALIDRVDGVDFVNTVTLAASGGALGTADVTLAAVAPMPKAGTINGTVTAET